MELLKSYCTFLCTTQGAEQTAAMQQLFSADRQSMLAEIDSLKQQIQSLNRRGADGDHPTKKEQELTRQCKYKYTYLLRLVWAATISCYLTSIFVCPTFLAFIR